MNEPIKAAPAPAQGAPAASAAQAPSATSSASTAPEKAKGAKPAWRNPWSNRKATAKPSATAGQPPPLAAAPAISKAVEATAASPKAAAASKPEKAVEAKPEAKPEKAKGSAKAEPEPEADPRIADLESRLKVMTEALTATATATLAEQSEEVRNAVSRIAGDDPSKQLATLTALRESGLSRPSASKPVTTSAQAKPQAASSSADSDTAVLREYERLRTEAPTLALLYKARHMAELTRATARNN